jgi:hypothetical protein
MVRRTIFEAFFIYNDEHPFTGIQMDVIFRIIGFFFDFQKAKTKMIYIKYNIKINYFQIKITVSLLRFFRD